MADIFDVLADPTRRDILHALLDTYVATEDERGELSVGELVSTLGLSQPTVSKHLKVLRDHDLVAVREEGQHRYYKLVASPLEAVEDWLIPFLSADFDGSDGDGAVFAAWAGTDVAASIGRKAAESQHRVSEAIHGASETLTKVIPKSIKDRWLDGKE